VPLVAPVCEIRPDLSPWGVSEAAGSSEYRRFACAGGDVPIAVALPYDGQILWRRLGLFRPVSPDVGHASTKSPSSSLPSPSDVVGHGIVLMLGRAASGHARDLIQGPTTRCLSPA